MNITDAQKQRAEEIRRWLCTDCDRTFSAPYLKHTAPGYSVPTYCDPGPNGWEPFVPESALSEAVAQERERCIRIIEGEKIPGSWKQIFAAKIRESA